jgi:tRNA threonylcarbamoyladenosine modification (KEOPS) complex  Pcc1 subunit
MQKNASATCKIYFSDKKRLDIALKALEPEVKKPATTRSRAKVKKNGAFLVLKVEAKDTVALRAALNAYLRWISSVLSVLEVVDTQ